MRQPHCVGAGPDDVSAGRVTTSGSRGVPRWSPPLRRAGLALLGLLLFVAAAPSWAGAASWPSAGQNFANSHSNFLEVGLGTQAARHLQVKWTYTTHGDVSATPAVVDGAVYFPDWGGYLNKVNALTGAPIWSLKLADLVGSPTKVVSRAGPAVDNGTVYLGTQGGARLLAINAATGALKWSRQLDSHPLAILTQSPLVFDGVVYQGVASLEENAAANPTYPCCSFQGSMQAVNAKTGVVLWKTLMLPDNHGQLGGFTGAGVWGSHAALDPLTNTVYITTGNNYSVPADVKQCELNGGTNCSPPANRIDAVVALNAKTGAVRWTYYASPGFDDWNVACFFLGPNCPVNPGPDYDFGSGPQLMVAKVGNHLQTLIGAGQKSGAYYALDAGTGQLVWANSAGPGSTLGGIEWGTSYDGRRIYIAQANFNGGPYQMANGQTVTSGSFAALDPATGHTLWQIADPSGGVDLADLSSANGVLYAGSMTGHMYAIDGATGEVLFDYLGDGSSIAGPAIVNGVLYWGNGYSNLPLPGFTPSTKFYAFAAP